MTCQSKSKKKNLTNNLRKSKKGEHMSTSKKSLSKCGFLPAETRQWSVGSEFKALLPGACRSSLAEAGKAKESYLCLESTRRLKRKPRDEDVFSDNCTLPLIQWGTLLVHKKLVLWEQPLFDECFPRIQTVLKSNTKFFLPCPFPWFSNITWI